VKNSQKSFKIREPINGFSHLGAAIAAGIGLVILLYLARGQFFRQLSLLIYGLSLVLMFSTSAIYHLVSTRPKVELWLRKLDHSAIYLLIAGTYTPICLYFFQGFWKWGLLAIVWCMAFAGILVKLFIIKVPRGFNAGIYLLMGWFSILGIRQMVLRMPPGALVLLLAGGIMFTLGALIYILKRPNLFPGVFGFHEVWHIFVILGALAHYIVVAAFIAAS
jgi:hemolysin III